MRLPQTGQLGRLITAMVMRERHVNFPSSSSMRISHT
jgi:hypothetical protein